VSVYTTIKLIAYQTRSPVVAEIVDPTLSGIVVGSMLIMAIWHRGGSLKAHGQCRGLKVVTSCS